MSTLNARRVLALTPAILLTGCNMVVMNPSGDIAAQQSNLIIISTALMLLIIVPVLALTILFAWRYRHNNTAAVYEPEWDHSTKLELIIWGAPLLIIIALGLLTWINTHTLDPYRKLSRLDATLPITSETKTLNVEVVALDWKWLFIYPDLGIATVNELAAPINMPIHFKITASSVMNSFYIPALAGQIYAMPGMQTELNAVINKPGVFDGFSANYSGAGFSDMRFKFKGMSSDDFDQWVQATKSGKTKLNRDDYLQLEKPSIRDQARRYSSVDASLYHAILNRCVESGKMCMDEMMAMDALGGVCKSPSQIAMNKPEFSPVKRETGISAILTR
ncbi:ubiquinol oxidase subunit II [Herbaspirillum sp. RTI4]|uniref:ubiquinol oxidase subunit II n=1 Tax=Herbaspirillum sp. RTI4 TaxID=3048640 RepID=UPI002AB54292|nr:ubiquinol oxidase subunit II [Herbaspirillum sp. RTI4]MDY7578893.1 ubiquinol oxidase subunit II [Herbaspirillum sp. RTI4]MEA9981982.1 ubiquinol oxidase subunit II [Herbaspirillum sp. RTI4]